MIVFNSFVRDEEACTIIAKLVSIVYSVFDMSSISRETFHLATTSETRRFPQSSVQHYLPDIILRRY